MLRANIYASYCFENRVFYVFRVRAEYLLLKAFDYIFDTKINIRQQNFTFADFVK